MICDSARFEQAGGFGEAPGSAHAAAGPASGVADAAPGAAGPEPGSAPGAAGPEPGSAPGAAGAAVGAAALEPGSASVAAAIARVSAVIVPALDANKYSRGKLVVVAGSARYPGAAVLAARASQRMGAGYTEVVTDERAVDIVRLSSPSLVVRPFSEWDASDIPVMREGKPCAACVGPGFAPGDAAAADATVRVLREARCPVLVDGGALACLSSGEAREVLANRADLGYSTVLTPHGGEASRLAEACGVEAGASALASALHAVVVLKGPDTHVSDGGRAFEMREGTSALAKAGTGDVLAGMIAALLAQGAGALDAAIAGATFHARAGIAAAKRLTCISVTAEDVIDSLPDALAESGACPVERNRGEGILPFCHIEGNHHERNHEPVR